VFLPMHGYHHLSLPSPINRNTLIGRPSEVQNNNVSYGSIPCSSPPARTSSPTLSGPTPKSNSGTGVLKRNPNDSSGPSSSGSAEPSGAGHSRDSVEDRNQEEDVFQDAESRSFTDEPSADEGSSESSCTFLSNVFRCFRGDNAYAQLSSDAQESDSERASCAVHPCVRDACIAAIRVFMDWRVIGTTLWIADVLALYLLM
jgi:hypothetical protein